MKLLFIVCAALLAVERFAAEAVARPNFVVIFTDDQTYRAIGYNNPMVKTPHLDRLAQRGMIFNRAYVATPICAASRASILTGLFPQQHQSVGLDGSGFENNVVKNGKYKTIAHLLTDAGYVTGFCGKSHLGDPKRYGFTHGKLHKDLYDNEPFAFAEKFVEARGADNKPFFLWVASRQPHVPLLPAQKWLDQYTDTQLKVDGNWLVTPPLESFFNQGLPGEYYFRDSKHTENYKQTPSGPPRSKAVIRDFMLAYYATISHLDHQVGRLAARLAETGLDKNTVIVFLSDNGYHLGNHGLGNKITMHEESVRVPMFIVDSSTQTPVTKGTAGRSDALVSSLDVMPTVLEMAGVEPPDYLIGKSLVPLLSDPQATVRDHVASECIGVGGKLGQGHRMIRGDRFKYLLSGTNEGALFDEQADPLELVNLAGKPEHTAMLATMRDKMNQWMQQVGDTHQPPPINP
jgi:arylsulfatase A-like enzyme